VELRYFFEMFIGVISTTRSEKLHSSEKWLIRTRFPHFLQRRNIAFRPKPEANAAGTLFKQVNFRESRFAF